MTSGSPIQHSAPAASIAARPASRRVTARTAWPSATRSRARASPRQPPPTISTRIRAPRPSRRGSLGFRHVTEMPQTIGVVGAGTMGAGIAQLACLAGARTLLHDPVGEALERGLEKVPADLKRGIFEELSKVAPEAVLATNTSSIPVTAIAGAAADPGRVVGMHFFNPAPLMRLVEVVAGVDSREEALAVARATGEA